MSHQPLRVSLVPLMYFIIMVSRLSAQTSPSDHHKGHSRHASRPNIILILADDLGYGELGCYGQQVIQTPALDNMARQGARFVQFYAGATVCAPSRSVLMTGLHQGHTRVRGNAGPMNPLAQALRTDDLTIARYLQQAGYHTVLIGKWGLGDVGPAESGLPQRQGFDEFLGYLNQQHAHNHFPSFLWRNQEPILLPNRVVPVGDKGAGYATEAKVYADDLFAEEVLKVIAQPRPQPLFLLWSMAIPHANNERTRALGNGAHVPDWGPYADRDWPDQDKGHAAMITRLDSYVARLLTALQERGLANQTIVFFTSDNGPHRESGHDPGRFTPAGPFRGMKRSLNEGGIRVPLIVWGPGKITPGKVVSQIGYFGDFFATCCELAGIDPPPGLDSRSILPFLSDANPPYSLTHEYYYWEFHERGFSQATLYQGRYKLIRTLTPRFTVELYDLQVDPGESRNLAGEHPKLVARLTAFLDTSRSASPDWPIPPVVPSPSPHNTNQ